MKLKQTAMIKVSGVLLFSIAPILLSVTTRVPYWCIARNRGVNLFCLKNKHGNLSTPDPKSNFEGFLVCLALMPKLFCIFCVVQE